MLRKYSFVYCLLLVALYSSLHAHQKESSFLYQIKALKNLKSSQWLGIIGVSGITGCLMYCLLPKLFAKNCPKMHDEPVHMAPKDLILLELLIACAARDLTKILNNEQQAFEVTKVRLDGMTPHYAAEAEYMRYEFLQTAALCLQDESIKPKLTAWFLQWQHAVEEACSRARSFFMQQPQQ